MSEPTRSARWTFARVYDQEVAFVWRNARRLGVAADHLDDVTQEVFVVVHRRLSEVADRPDLRGWVLSILFGVVANHRRSLRRRGGTEALDDASVPGSEHAGPEEQTARAEAAEVLYAILAELDADKREVFVLAELEQLPAQEIAGATATNVNTVYARLRAARREFNAAVARFRSRDEWRLR